jgi:hypothetical protein
MCGTLPKNINPKILQYFLFLSNFAVIFSLFVILFSLPKQRCWGKWRRKIEKLRIQYQHQNIIYLFIL